MRILRLRTVLNKVGLGKTKLYSLIAEGKFPRQIRLTERAVGWSESEVDAWIIERRKRCDQKNAA